ncbi:GNAT family N-acetyltransferase [Streptosporangium carneum]|uniref:N-acetyltransferase n=1 Tax=Streptosporangium carneum TaxID=47481 RepID=A0A9W6I0R7_9ACTN|nr:GNAT family N-acetyltransferase [Streptosporangium carneum]GLK09573.1 N-acetyltransferase [Streptosporangium carneum]
MRIERIDFTDPGSRTAQWHAAYLTSQTGVPGPLPGLRRFTVMVERGWSNHHVEAWVAEEAGLVVGGCSLHFPTTDNTHSCDLRFLVVHPGHRRRGTGSALLEHCVRRARAHGRELILSDVRAEEAADAFAAGAGAELGMVNGRRALDLHAADWPGLDGMRARAVRHAEGYRLERWAGATPPELAPDMVALMAGMNDAPHDGLEVEGARWDAERYLLSEEAVRAAGLLTYTTLARHGRSGEPAGFTQLHVSREDPGNWGQQGDTTVLAAHRGRRLGLLMKIENAAWFHEREPSVQRVVTWNADSNTHMVAINELMGFRTLDRWHHWQLRL